MDMVPLPLPSKLRCQLCRICLLLVLAYCAGPALAVPEIGQPAPALKGRLFSGAPFDLAQMHGKVVLVNFYSSYCSFFAYEIGLLEALYERYRADGLEVIAVGVDAPEDRPRVERMLGIYNLPERWPTSWRRMALRGVIPRPPHSSSIAKGYYAIASPARSDRTTTKSWSYPLQPLGKLANEPPIASRVEQACIFAHRDNAHADHMFTAKLRCDAKLPVQQSKDLGGEDHLRSDRLSSLDLELATVYARLLRVTSGDTEKNLTSGQRKWWAARGECSKQQDPVACLEDKYTARIAALKEHPDYTEARPGPVELHRKTFVAGQGWAKSYPGT